MNLLLSKKRYLRTLLVVSLFLWFLVNSFATLRRIVSFYTPLPVEDYWRVVENLPAYQAFDMSVLWMQHNEHRIVFPEIVFMLDMLLAHGCMILPLTGSFLCYAATWLLLSATVLGDADLPKWRRFAISLLAGVIALFETSALVLAVPFLIQWTLMQFAATGSLVLLSRVDSQRHSPALWQSAVAASVATYSSSNGFLLWPLLIGLGKLRGFPIRSLLFLGICALGNTGLYFVGYRFSHRLNLAQLFAHPGYLLGFSASYVSMPFGGMKAPAFGISIGTFNLLTALCCFVIARRKNILSSAPAVVLFGSYVFTLVTALITAAGRMDVADRSFLAAKAVRYISVPQMNWAVLVLLTLWLSSKLQFQKAFRAFLLLFSVGFLVSFLKLDRWLTANAKPFVKAQYAAQRIELGYLDQDLIGNYVYKDLGLVSRGLSRLQKSNLSLYYLDRHRLTHSTIKSK